MAKVVKQKTTLLQKADFQSYLEDKAREMAPRDVEVLLSQAETARSRALADQHPRLGAQMVLALELLADHDDGQCPQIPFYTISLLAEAVYYFLDPNDVIPDWIPEIGKLDDALIMELAFELGSEGIHRYCAWKDVDVRPLYQSAESAPARKDPAKSKSGAKRRSAVKKTSGKRKSTRKTAGKKAKKRSASSPKRTVAKKKPGAKKTKKRSVSTTKLSAIKKKSVAKKLKKRSVASKRRVAAKKKSPRRKSR